MAKKPRCAHRVCASRQGWPRLSSSSPNTSPSHPVARPRWSRAELDLQKGQIARILPLGKKDFSPPGNAIDPSDQDGGVSFRNVPVKGLYMPDAIVSYSAGGKPFYVMANEGGAFVDDADIVRLGNAAVTLDLGVFPDAAALKSNAQLGRLNILREGVDGSGSSTSTSMTEIVTLGGRSFSIRDADGQLVYDSGNTLETQAQRRGVYADGRSDDKGVEPEGVSVFDLGGRTLAFSDLERTTRSAVAIFDISDPANASFVDMIVSDDASVLRPEGLVAFSSGGRHFLPVAHESTVDSIEAGGLSNRTVLYEITPVPEPGAYALMLAALGGVGWASRRRR